jgi:hypothetical protein
VRCVLGCGNSFSIQVPLFNFSHVSFLSYWRHISHLNSNFFLTTKFLYHGICPLTFCILIYVAIHNNEMKKYMLIKLYIMPISFYYKQVDTILKLAKSLDGLYSLSSIH